MPQGHNAIPLGDGTVLIDLPNTFSVDVDEEGTVNAVPSANPEVLTLRFTVLTVGAKDPKETCHLNLAEEVIAEARERGTQAHCHEDKAWFHEERHSTENGEAIWLQFWHIGYRNRRGIFSLCCCTPERFTPLVQHALALVPRLIPTLRVREEHSPLTPMEESSLEAQRGVIAQVLQEQFDCYSMPGLKADLPVLQHLIDDQVFTVKQEHEWSCLGVVFGDILASAFGLDWISYCDEYGAEPALNLPNTSIVVFPRTMVLKRVERGEQADLEDLFSGMEETINQLRNQS